MGDADTTQNNNNKNQSGGGSSSAKNNNHNNSGAGGGDDDNNVMMMTGDGEQQQQPTIAEDPSPSSTSSSPEKKLECSKKKLKLNNNGSSDGGGGGGVEEAGGGGVVVSSSTGSSGGVDEQGKQQQQEGEISSSSNVNNSKSAEAAAAATTPTSTTTATTTATDNNEAMITDDDPTPTAADDKNKNNEETAAAPKDSPPAESLPLQQIQVIYNKQPIPLSIHPPTTTVLQLKEMIKTHTGVDPPLQKVLLKGIAKDDQILGDLGVGPGTKKILVIGSSIQEVLEVKKVPDTSTTANTSEAGSSSSGNNWCSVTVHKKVVDKGLPDDAMPGILNEHDPLPPFPLHGMLSSKGSKVRLTFKLESDELWIGTKERTEKVPIGTIRNVVSQPITGYEHYHIVAIQLGPTEASRFFVYWVPAQYVESIKDALTGA